MPPPVRRDLAGQLSDILERIGILESRRRPSGVQVGSVSLFAGPDAPTGTLVCNGSVYDPSEYPSLYAVIGSTYGGTALAPLLPSIPPHMSMNYIIQAV